MSNDGRIVSLVEIELTPTAIEYWREQARILAASLAGSWHCDVPIPDMAKGRVREGVLYLFAHFVSPQKSSFTFDVPIPEGEWNWKNAPSGPS